MALDILVGSAYGHFLCHRFHRWCKISTDEEKFLTTEAEPLSNVCIAEVPHHDTLAIVSRHDFKTFEVGCNLVSEVMNQSDIRSAFAIVLWHWTS